MEDFPNTPEGLRETFDILRNAYSGNIELRLASENMLDSLFEERLERNEFLPIGAITANGKSAACCFRPTSSLL